jgi:hypothetical protein
MSEPLTGFVENQLVDMSSHTNTPIVLNVDLTNTIEIIDYSSINLINVPNTHDTSDKIFDMMLSLRNYFVEFMTTLTTDDTYLSNHDILKEFLNNFGNIIEKIQKYPDYSTIVKKRDFDTTMENVLYDAYDHTDCTDCTKFKEIHKFFKCITMSDNLNDILVDNDHNFPDLYKQEYHKRREQFAEIFFKYVECVNIID